MGKCVGHAFEIHRHIVRIAIQHHLNIDTKSVVPAVTLTCSEVNEILARIIARTPNHGIGHTVNPMNRVIDKVPYLICSYCECPLTTEAEVAYCELILHLSPSKKQSPR